MGHQLSVLKVLQPIIPFSEHLPLKPFLPHKKSCPVSNHLFSFSHASRNVNVNPSLIYYSAEQTSIQIWHRGGYNESKKTLPFKHFTFANF